MSKTYKAVGIVVALAVVAGGSFWGWRVVRPKKSPFERHVSEVEHIQLLTGFTNITGDYFQGKITVEERNQALKKLFSELNPKANAEKDKYLKTDLMIHGGMITSLHLLPFVLKKAFGQDLTVREKKLLSGVNYGELSSEAYVEEGAKNIKPHVETLRSYGATFSLEKGWDLGKKLSPAKLKNDIKLYEAIALLISPEVARSLADEWRQKPLRLDGKVYLPPARKPASQKGAK